jgi:hypothetical protein
MLKVTAILFMSGADEFEWKNIKKKLNKDRAGPRPKTSFVEYWWQAENKASKGQQRPLKAAKDCLI